MRIFISELSRCLKVKTIYKLIAFLSFTFGVLGVIGLWIYTLFQPPKTQNDFVKDYIVCRMNFTPDTVKKAYYCSLQYTDPYYDERINPILQYIAENGIYQMFILQDLKHSKGYWIAKGELVRFSCKNEAQDCLKLIDTTKEIKIYEVKGKFAVEEEF